MKVYSIVQAAEDRNPFDAEPHLGVSEELMLAIGRSFLSGSSKLTYLGRTYPVSKSTFVVYEMEPAVVGNNPQEAKAFFERIARERKLGLIYKPRESLLKEYGKDITPEVLIRLEDERRPQPGEQQKTVSQIDFWSLIHPRVLELSQKLYNDGHRKEAVQAALTEIDEVVARKYRAAHKDGKFGMAMMSKSFAKDAPVIQL